MLPHPSRLPLLPLTLVSLLAASGCKEDEKPYGQDAFANDYAEAVCTLYEQCQVMRVRAGFESSEECVEEVSEDAAGCDGFSSKKAVACVDGVNTLQCEELFDGDWPEDCASACSDGGAEHGFSVDAD